MMQSLLNNRVLICPESAELYNRLVDNEFYIGESNDELTMHSNYEGDLYVVRAVKVLNFYVVVSIYNKTKLKEMSTLVD